MLDRLWSLVLHTTPRQPRSAGGLMRSLAMTLLMVQAVLAQDERLTARDLSTVVGAVVRYRRTVSEDPTPVDFCKVRVVWDSKGHLHGAQNWRPWLLYTDRADCPAQPSRSPRQVIIESLRVRGDTVVVQSTSVRGGTRLGEEYELVRQPDGALQERLYRIYSIVVP